MSDDAEHKCHCAHVVILRTQVSTVQWAVGIVAIAAIGTIMTLAGSFISRRLSWEAPAASASERLFLDRVSKPDPPSKDHGQ